VTIRFAQCCGKVFGNCNDCITCGCCGHFDVMGKPVNSVDNAACIGQRCPDGEATVVMEAQANLVASDGLDCKEFASVSRFMSKDFDARWSERCLVKVEVAVDLRVCG
jgi:hypothetical protein